MQAVCHCWRCQKHRALAEHKGSVSAAAHVPAIKVLTIQAHDPDGTLEKLLHAIQHAGNGGHSFSIVVDPDAGGGEKFFWDGDGADRISDIRTSGAPTAVAAAWLPEKQYRQEQKGLAKAKALRRKTDAQAPPSIVPVLPPAINAPGLGKFADPVIDNRTAKALNPTGARPPKGSAPAPGKSSGPIKVAPSQTAPMTTGNVAGAAAGGGGAGGGGA
jgi:hypothetical protein